MKYTDEELCERLNQLADKLGEPPTASQCDVAETTPSSKTYHNRFGSWNAALEAAGLPINKENPSYTDDELIARLGEFAKRLGETPTHTQVAKSSEMPSATAYEDRFGGWNDALEAAGLDINQESSFTDTELLTVLREFATELGHTPSAAELDNRTDLPSSKPYTDHFESWNAALRAAGLTPNTRIEQYDGTDEELLEMLREFAAERDTSPTQDDFNFAPDVPNAAVFANRFGGWNAAKQQAGLDTTHQPTQYTDTELLRELQRVAHEQEKSPTTAEMNNTDAPSPSTYCRRFGSWSDALEEAGLVENREPPTQ